MRTCLHTHTEYTVKPLILLQVLGILAQPSSISTEQHAVNRQPPPAALPLHRHLRSARDAAVRWQVQLQSDG